MPSPHTSWSLADLIDYELGLREKLSDETASAESIRKLRNETLPELDDSTRAERTKDTRENRRWWLHRWMEANRLRGPQSEGSAGELIQSAFSSLNLVCAFLGVLLGASLLSSVLGVTAIQKQPVNIATFLGICLAPQLLLFLGATFSVLAYRFGWQVRAPILLRFVTAVLIRPLFARITAMLSPVVSDELKSKLRSEAGLIVGRSNLHRRALAFPVMKALQWLAVTCSLTIAGGLFLLLQVRHIPFAWQTSNYQWSAEPIYKVVRILARPWSGIWGEGIGYPSQEEIRQSQTFVDRPGDLQQEAFVSWGLFAVLCLFTYACLPRLILLLYTMRCEKQALRQESFEDARSDRLFLSLSQPQVEFAHPAQLQSETVSHSTVAPASHPQDTSALTQRESIIVLPPDIDTPEVRAQISRTVETRLHWRAEEFHRIHYPDEQEKFLTELRGRNSPPRILFAKRAHDPITRNVRHFIEQILEAVGPKCHLVFGVGGKIDFTGDPVPAEERLIWQEYANELMMRSPNIEVLNLTGA